MSVNDLAASAVYGPLAPEQLLVGNEGYDTDSGVATAAITKYRVVAITAAGIAPFDFATHTAAQAALALQPCALGGRCVYAYKGRFNDDLIVAYSGYGTPAAAGDTYAERKLFFTGQFRVGKLMV